MSVTSRTTAEELKSIEANLSEKTDWLGEWYFLDRSPTGKNIKVQVWIEDGVWVQSTDGLAMSPHCQNDLTTAAPSKTKFHPRYPQPRY